MIKRLFTSVKHQPPLSRSLTSANNLIHTDKPYQMPAGHLKLATAALLSMYVGGKVAQQCANILEENEIFVHDEYEDDD